jgi:hypothetical protein
LIELDGRQIARLARGGTLDQTSAVNDPAQYPQIAGALFSWLEPFTKALH